MTDTFLAVSRYQPDTPFSGRVDLLRAEDIAPIHDHVGDKLGWDGRALGGVDVHHVPGDHDDLVLEPNVHELVKYLRQCLDDAQDRTDTVSK